MLRGAGEFRCRQAEFLWGTRTEYWGGEKDESKLKNGGLKEKMVTVLLWVIDELKGGRASLLGQITRITAMIGLNTKLRGNEYSVRSLRSFCQDAMVLSLCSDPASCFRPEELIYNPFVIRGKSPFFRLNFFVNGNSFIRCPAIDRSRKYADGEASLGKKKHHSPC